MNPPKSPDSLLVHVNPTRGYLSRSAAAGGGHILDIDFWLLQICATGQRAARAKTNTLLTTTKKKMENKEKKLFLNKEKLRLLLKLWQIRRPNWRRNVQFRCQLAIPGSGAPPGLNPCASGLPRRLSLMKRGTRSSD